MDNYYLAAYVTVYEHKGGLFGGYKRTFMRHSSIVVDRGSGTFDCFHVTGTPGIGLTYSCVQQWGDPRATTARLLSMDFAGWIPWDRYGEMGPLLSSVPTLASRTWNCQNWVREALDAMVNASFISAEDKDRAVQKQLEAINLPFTTETPNAQALQD
jgi:Family of unknown function (DUF6540)